MGHLASAGGVGAFAVVPAVGPRSLVAGTVFKDILPLSTHGPFVPLSGISGSVWPNFLAFAFWHTVHEVALGAGLGPEGPEDEAGEVGLAASAALALAVEGPDAELVEVFAVAGEVEGPEDGPHFDAGRLAFGVEREEEEADSVEDQEVADGAGDGEDSRVGFVVDGAPGEKDREEAEAIGVFALLEARLGAAGAVEEEEAPVVAFVAAGDRAEGPEDVRDAAELGGAGLGFLVAVEGAQGEEGGSARPLAYYRQTEPCCILQAAEGEEEAMKKLFHHNLRLSSFPLQLP